VTAGQFNIHALNVAIPSKKLIHVRSLYTAYCGDWVTLSRRSAIGVVEDRRGAAFDRKRPGSIPSLPSRSDLASGKTLDTDLPLEFMFFQKCLQASFEFDGGFFLCHSRSWPGHKHAEEPQETQQLPHIAFQ
jgi:hypothetical protein